jgi:hypothetical protein
MSNKYTVWDRPGVVEALKAAAAPGIYTAFELSALLSQRFDCDISRNAVMGKCWRLNIPLRGRTAPKPKAVKPNKPLAVIQEYLKAPRISLKNIPNCPEPEPKGDTSKGCRWMHGDATDRNFCGADVVRFGTSWCAHHSHRVWAGPSASLVRVVVKNTSWRAA